MYAEISAAIQGAKSLGELIKAAHSLSNYNELVAAVSEINMRLMDATAVALKSQERQAELQDEVAHLQAQIAELRAAIDQSKNYHLHKFETGALAYAYTASSGEVPEHFLCPTCFDKGSHSKLQPEGSYALKCNTCNSVIQYKLTPPRQPIHYRLSGL